MTPINPRVVIAVLTPNIRKTLISSIKDSGSLCSLSDGFMKSGFENLKNIHALTDK